MSSPITDLREGARLLLQHAFYPSDRAIAERLIALADSMEKAAPVAWLSLAGLTGTPTNPYVVSPRAPSAVPVYLHPPAPGATVDEKVARAKLDNEAYQRGYADGMKHASAPPAEGEFGALLDALQDALNAQARIRRITDKQHEFETRNADARIREARARVLNAYAARAKDGEDAARVRHIAEHAEARYQNAVRILTAIHALLHPSLVTTPDGRKFAFKSPYLDEQMQALSDKIRGIPDELAAIDAARAGEVGK